MPRKNSQEGELDPIEPTGEQLSVEEDASEDDPVLPPAPTAEEVTEKSEPVQSPPQTTATPPPSKIYSRSGELFDPAIHVSPDSQTKSGAFRRKKGAGNIEKEVYESDSEKQARLALAEFSTQNFYILGQFLTPTFDGGKDERAYVRGLFENCYAAYGVVDMPPWLALTIGLVGLSGAKIATAPDDSRAKKMLAKFMKRPQPETPKNEEKKS